MIRQVFLPGPELAPHVRNILVGGFANLANHLPAMAASQVVIYIRGRSTLSAGRDIGAQMPAAFVAGPTLFPRSFQVDPGSEFLGVSFRPMGLQACIGIPADLCRDQAVPLENFFPRPLVQQLLEQLAATVDRRARAELVEQFLVGGLRRLHSARRHPSSLLVLTLDALHAPAERLAKQLSISQRQLERRFLQAYGMPLRDYRRLSRFTAALLPMMTQAQRPGGLTCIAQDAGYTDQSHLIRDFRAFIGAAPGQFLKAFEQPESDYSFWKFSRPQLRSYID